MKNLKQLSLPDWRPLFPTAASEISEPFHPLLLEGADEFGEHWYSSQYQVVKRKYSFDPVFGSRSGMIYLGISNYDQTARHDWRHFQEIKNQLAGPDWEAIEVYPAEDRLVDPSNEFLLWCFRVTIKVGPRSRNVLSARESFAPQRAMPEEAKP
jgi:hypothetical protein